LWFEINSSKPASERWTGAPSAVSVGLFTDLVARPPV